MEYTDFTAGCGSCSIHYTAFDLEAYESMPLWTLSVEPEYDEAFAHLRNSVADPASLVAEHPSECINNIVTRFHFVVPKKV